MAIRLGSSKGFAGLLGLAQTAGASRKLAEETKQVQAQQAQQRQIQAQETAQELEMKQAEERRMNQLADARDQYLQKITLDERKRTLDWQKELDKQQLDYEWDIKTHDAYKKADAEYQVGRDQAKKIEAEKKLVRRKQELDSYRESATEKHNNGMYSPREYLMAMRAYNYMEDGFTSVMARNQAAQDIEYYKDSEISSQINIMSQQMHMKDLEAANPTQPTALDVVGTATQTLGVNFGDMVKQTTTNQELTADMAAKYLQEAGGDKNKARKLAQEAGYVF